MSATHDKHSALEALRQRLGSPGTSNSARPLLRAVQDGQLDPALFVSGLHEVVGETPADFAAALAFALSAAGQKKQPQRALFFGALTTDSQERGLL